MANQARNFEREEDIFVNFKRTIEVINNEMMDLKVVQRNLDKSSCLTNKGVELINTKLV